MRFGLIVPVVAVAAALAEPRSELVPTKGGSMRFGATIPGLVAALTVVGGALAASAAQDPQSLALRRSDFPANAQRMGGKAIEPKKLSALFGGARGTAYGTTYQFPSGQKREFVFDIVVVCASPAQARGTFAALVKVQHPGTAVRLPSFGDKQVAVVTGDARNEEAGGWIVVRKSSIVWELDIDTDPLAKDFGFSKAQVLAELRKYAAKQKLRVREG
jgi:hypothetical protein